MPYNPDSEEGAYQALCTALNITNTMKETKGKPHFIYRKNIQLIVFSYYHRNYMFSALVTFCHS